MARLRVAVLISGRGSNLQSLLDACERPDFPAEIALVISNRADAGGLQRAERAGVPRVVIDHRAYPDRETFDAAIDRALRDADIALVCLAGFMRLLTKAFVTTWQGRLINIHPSLLPSFKGMHTHAQALEAGVKIHGCTVHFVTPDLDAGPILAQAAVPVCPDDTEAVLAARVLTAEHRLYPQALKRLAEKRARLEGDRVILDDDFNADQILLNPAD
ncbi:MAG TPA: phosphoribosylglycinamide formyltransferase [Telmatospirillum sp.]|nr:phosphoribosylglycinamide formyltransferase [Telmatospirillum sp.]